MSCSTLPPGTGLIAEVSYAPLALRSGAWLQWLVGMAQADDPIALRALGLYAGDVGVGHPSASRGAAYLRLMSAQRLARHVSPAGHLVSPPAREFDGQR